jgi:hypothetical protein
MDFKTEAMEYVKIYFAAHPEELPKDPKEAVVKMKKIHGQFKNNLIQQEHKRSEDFFNH